MATVLAEVFWFRTGIFRKAQYWLAMAIVYFFHVLVDGWLTKLSAPIVIYDEGQITGVRVPWDIPVEDYLFGFSMITLTLILWVRLGDRSDDTGGDTVTDPQRREEWVLADAFDRAAPTYDAMVALSPGYHDQLRTAAEALVDRLPAAGAGRVPAAGARPRLRVRCVDPGGARRLGARRALGRRAVGHRRRRLRGHGRPGAAQGVALERHASSSPTPSPTSTRCPSGSVDGVLAAYLLRNVPDRDRLVDRGRPGAAARRRDRRSTTTRWPAAPAPAPSGRRCATASSSRCAVAMRSDVPLHRYLYTSVRDFDSVERICDRLLSTGLVDVRHRSYPGWQHGLVHTVAGSAAS